MNSYDNFTDPIVALALRVARRADEIRQHAAGTSDNLRPWLRAEEEILGVRLPHPVGRAAARQQAHHHADIAPGISGCT
jgi:hypothetical protein